MAMPNSLRHCAALVLLVGCAAFAVPAQAYIGPGMATGALATVLGVLAGIVMLVIGAVWYPIKRLIQRFKRKP